MRTPAERRDGGTIMTGAQLIELIVGGVAIGAIYGLIGLGFSMIIRATGIFHFAQGEIMMLGAMLGLSAESLVPLPFPALLVVGMIGGGISAIVVELLVYRTLRLRRVPLINIAIATIGMSILLQNASLQVWGSEPMVYPKLFATAVYHLGPIAVSPQSIWIMVLGIALVVLLQAFLKFTRTGLALQAAAQDPETAQLMGINLTHSTALTFGVAGAMAGAAGVLLGSLFFASFNMGFLPSIKAFVAATLGGLGSIGGALLGGIVFGLIETFSARWLSSGYRDAVGMAMLIVILLAFPQGLIGLFKRRG
jgi:branched-chain amino acid transport system permease protein